MNNVSLIGRLGKDPEVRNTSSGKTVANFTLAVDYGFGDRKTTSWIPVHVWEKTAELAGKFLAKGSQVAVEGRLQQRSWEDRDGNTRSVLEVVGDRLDFLTKATKSTSQSEFDSPNQQDDDPPF